MHEVVVNRPPIVPAAYANLDDLVILKQELYYDYRKPPDYRVVYRDIVQMIHDYPYERLQRGVQLKDGPMMLELGIRSIVGCEVQGYNYMEDVLELLERLTGLELPIMSLTGKTVEEIHGVDYKLRKRALAACAWLNFLCHFTCDPEGSLYAYYERPWLHNAAYYATMLCLQEPIPPIALRIGNWLMQLGRRYRVDIRAMEGFEKFAALWRTYDDFMISQAAAEKQRLTKILGAPNRYRCAADGCGIQAINSRALRKCSGNCPEQFKPHYCSLECQKKHWFVHRYACKRCLPSPPIVDDDNDPDWVDIEKYDTRYIDNSLPDWLIWSEWNGPEIFIDFPHPGTSYEGDIIRVRSKTFGPEFLRSYRWLWQAPSFLRVNIDYSEWIS
ncbi:hypothetical protein C8Q80DRAFT_1115421 [Daedaleopsis nitida]|nr:hypothetical protein C8Q80DRAFT_1115649 [Daedaleopsis nitida]KAI0737316.1 hypothetical protein C8Q80DRAFT_1115421 [Daedaleopsis nitida]